MCCFSLTVVRSNQPHINCLQIVRLNQLNIKVKKKLFYTLQRLEIGHRYFKRQPKNYSPIGSIIGSIIQPYRQGRFCYLLLRIV